MTITPLSAPQGAALPHPVRAVLAARRISVTQLADAIGYSRVAVSNVIYKHFNATPEMRARVTAALDLPESALFDPEVSK